MMILPRPKMRPWQAKFKTDDTIVERKYDGHRLTACKTKDLQLIPKMVSRDLLPQLQYLPWAEALNDLPENTQLDGEIWYPNCQVTDIVTRIKNQEPLLYTVFATPLWDGESQDSLRSEVDSFGCSFPQTVPYTSAEDLISLSTREKWEGVVLKNSHYSDWYKLKPIKTVDCVVLDVAISQSILYTGQLQSIEVGVYEGESTTSLGWVGCGFSAEQKANPREYLGKVCEIAYDSLTTDQKLRFARFLRIREDKLCQECTIDQL